MYTAVAQPIMDKKCPMITKLTTGHHFRRRRDQLSRPDDAETPEYPDSQRSARGRRPYGRELRYPPKESAYAARPDGPIDCSRSFRRSLWYYPLLSWDAH